MVLCVIQFGFDENFQYLMFFQYCWQRRIKQLLNNNKKTCCWTKQRFPFFPLLAFNAENILIMEAVWLNILCFGKDSLALEVSFNCCVLRIYHWSEEKGTEKELQIADLCAARIVSDNPGLTVGCSASAAWQGATVPWPCRLHSCHLYRSLWPHRCGYKWRQIVCQTPCPSHTQPFTAGIKDGL